MEKPADNELPLVDVLRRRWSPRSFTDKRVEPQKLKQLFEAARWSASSYNEQPWRFLMATQDQPEEYQKILACLVETNRKWAKLAPVLMITLAKKTFDVSNKAEAGKPNRVNVHDVGAAMAQLTTQATAMNLYVHQMAGVDPDQVRETFGVPDDFEVVAGVALGYGGEPGQLEEEWMRKAEQAERTRLPFEKFVFTGKFGETSFLFKD